MTSLTSSASDLWASARRPVEGVLDHQVGGPLVKGVLLTALFLVVVTSGLFNANTATLFNGLATGSLYGLIGVGIILIYRTNRIINFAAAGMGAVPGVLAALLLVGRGWSWYVCFPIAVVGGLLLGALIDVLIIRRFSNAPRLILTVATIGVSQILAFLALKLPDWLNIDRDQLSYVPTPFKNLPDWWPWGNTFSIGITRFSWDYPFTLVVVALASLALAAFLRYTRVGIALRASAENADRASLLGIPVKRVQTVAWVIAGLIAALVIFLRTALVGVPTDGTLGPKVLLFALTAAVIARMDNIPLCLVAGLFVGMLAEAAVAKTGADSLASAIMLAVILGAMLLQRGRSARALDTGVSSFRSVAEFRPVPRELRGVREVRAGKWVLGGAVALLLVGLPFPPFDFYGLVSLVKGSQVGFTHLVLIHAIVAVSLVILTGWAGQISLGQFGIVGAGALTAGYLVSAHNQDFFVVLVAAALVGAAVSVLIGLPALRIPGLYLAVTTLAFAAAVQFYFLDPRYPLGERFLPSDFSKIDPPVLWERWSLTNSAGIPTVGFYYVLLVILAVAMLAARAYRKNRAGRVIIAVRDNARGAQSYSVNPARNKLAAFAISGAIAAVAGAMLAYQTRTIDPSTYGIDPSIEIFVMTVIGGLTSLPGAVFGVMALKSVQLFGNDLVDNLNLLVTGPGLVLVLLFLPGGFAQGLYQMRDGFLRWVADRNGIHVPSLVADMRVDADAEAELITEAEEHQEELEDEGALATSAAAPRGGDR